MRPDPHSYYDDSQPRIATLDWHARVDFDARVLDAEATLRLAVPGAGPLDLDTRALSIASVRDDRGGAVPFALDPADPVLGARLRLTLAPGTAVVTIAYRTSPEASALQWLDASQTSSGKPFLFSQCQAIHARAVVPLQDSPRARLTFTAALTVPAWARGLMAAGHVGREERGAEAIETWQLPQSIPPYLFAFAVGELASREVGPRSRVWAEPATVASAAHEFAGVEAMLAAGEALFGPYDWERYDLLVMPPSFPYGGMENPRLSFLTPSLLAGDRSLVSVVAHELAHSWTGNLVSNADAGHFWLNEGFTVYAERRIVEALWGRAEAELHAALGRRSLERAFVQLAAHPALTALRTELAGVDPDEAFSAVPYEKGYLFLRALEESAGRPAFDALLRGWLGAHRFQSVTTDDFVAYLDAHAPGLLARVDAEAWLHHPGLPPSAPVARSERLAALEATLGTQPDEAIAGQWSPTEWQLFLDGTPRPAPPERLAALDARYQLSQRANLEILVAWLVLCAESGYAPTLARTAEVLGEVGRMKYLKPLYTALAKGQETRALARSCFARWAGQYHPIARQVVGALLLKNGA